MIHLALLLVLAQDKHPIGYDDTPMLPGNKWHIHDGKRPAPPVVTPGPPVSVAPPSDAIVLFDGKDASMWRGSGGKEPGWKVVDGCLEIAAGKGDIESKEEFGDCQLHLEWCEPASPKGEGQERGNSGVFLMGRYELQILDSFENPTYPDGQCGAVYGQFPPLVNASRKPGEWQSYDVIFIAPRFDSGRLAAPAIITVFQNGVLIHQNDVLYGATAHRAFPRYTDHPLTAPLKLQDHGDPIRFRNIWARHVFMRGGN